MDERAEPPELEQDAAASARGTPPAEPLEAEKRSEGAELLDYEPADTEAPDDGGGEADGTAVAGGEVGDDPSEAVGR